MSQTSMVTIDGNEAAAYIAHLTNEVIAIYPITPSSPMGEYADAWSAEGVKNLWGTIPEVIEMQSEGGAAGAIHGALQTGSLATTFTASQGLLLMIPNMYKIAGELTPFVMHVAARSLAAQGLSIFGDHSDVMSVRATGFAFLASNSVQEAMDMALIAQAATLESRVPILHFFDGFRTSHEVAKVEQVPVEVVREMIDDKLVFAHRARALSPDHPAIRGTAQNPDVYFQARETVNPFYDRMPEIVQRTMDKFAGLTGRQYHIYEYVGAPDAERVMVLMGSGAEAAEETVDHLNAHGEKVGLVKVRLYRPFAADELLSIIPATARRIAVMDRTKEPGADGEPLYKDVVTAIAEAFTAGEGKFATMPRVVGGRYGLSSKEFTPGMIKGVFDELKKDQPKNHFTIGIIDDLTHTSLEWDADFRTDAGHGVNRCMFYGLGSDGTVGANKNTIKIMGEETELYDQGYFVYDSKKAGAATISHLRFSPRPIHSPYLIGDNEANFVGCHQPIFLERYDMLSSAAEGAVFLLNSPEPAGKVWNTLTHTMQQQIITKKLEFYVIDAYAIAKATGMGTRINTIMQTCFFAISGVLPRDVAIEKIKHAAEKSYSKKGRAVVEANWKAIDETIANLHKVEVTKQATSTHEMPETVPAFAPEFVRKITAEIMAGHGDRLPVSALPNDGTWPTGTSQWDKRNLAQEIPVWDEELCIYCGKCPFVCPHTAIRSKVFPAGMAEGAPPTFKHIQVKGKEFEQGMHISYQVAPEDCTGCTLCVDICPAVSKVDGHKALEMRPQAPLREQERENFKFFLTLPEFDRTKLRTSTIKGAMVMEPLFEFPTACVGCGETPYIRLASQLFGDRMVIANATGCSSIYGGNLPTTPYSQNVEGRGPAWANSLFEDNAEFGLGFRVSIDKHAEHAGELLEKLKDRIDGVLVDAILNADQTTEAGIFAQRECVEQLRQVLAGIDAAEARQLESLADYLVKKSVWIIGGDGWAYDIGFGGLDHVIASGRNVNILVLDTEVYSNTGGQASKATPRGAMAKFAAGGKHTGKKDLAQIAMSYGHVYVAHVAYGAKDIHTLKTFLEAESFDGPSLIIAYSPCGEHGYDLSKQHQQQELAVSSGHWPLFTFDPRREQEGKNPLKLDSQRPSVSYREFIQNEPRFRGLVKEMDSDGGEVLAFYENELQKRFAFYEQMAGVSGKGAEAGVKKEPTET
ncbi:pyruvate:ferredoxin (flavodoxin) oxidoreductase,homodimeric [Sulfuricella sp. T08]|uniref:pyruvate:ferredoxin (flavodoxin) oxidoreductase n=1 Tax=Sulfuricella sp. T08 TaxID=1632857 RepID=UPI0006179D05|nr:pyruvate:ferredoxin (flavodoxin) oxidoreductase [Sulfuricella sp. T08]GAO35295.1 pyruvate:ferredoxin (flavodoxin) oxidoreductase,homodimeric [Sulfuricella sp. T08]